MHHHRHSYEREGCGSEGGLKKGLVIAAVATGAAYLLFKTDKGYEIRQKIKGAAKKMKDKAIEVKEKMQSSGEELAETAKEISEGLSSLLKEKRDQIMKLVPPFHCIFEHELYVVGPLHPIL